MTTAVTDLAERLAQELASESSALAALDAADAVDPLPSADSVRSQLPAKGTTVGLHRLLSRCLNAEGETAEAEQITLAVTERLNQAGYWNAVGRLTAELLAGFPRDAVPLLSRARAQGGPKAVTDELLEAAHAAVPKHGQLAWQVVQARQARGDLPKARKLAAQILPELIEDKNYTSAEEALLLLGDDTRYDTVRSLVRSLELLARHETWDLFSSVLSMGTDAMATEHGAPLAWPVIQEIWLTHPEREDLRAAGLRIARSWVRKFPEPDAILRASEIERPSQSGKVVLERFRRVLRLPPGYYARHHGWGIGKILENDTENVIIDFPGKPGHRMSYGTAENALMAMAPDDLRVLLAIDPDSLQKMRKADPVGLVVLALRTLPGEEGDQNLIRKTLAPAPIPPASWAAWWKTTKVKAAQDPRLDGTRAFENFFALAIPGDGDDEGEVDIPTWAGKDLKSILTVMETFLDQHPDSRQRLLDEHGDRIRVLAAGTDASPAEAVVAGLWLLRTGVSEATPETHVDRKFDPNALNRADQEALVERLTDTAALGAMLDSRLAAIRKAAWKRLGTDEARETAARRRLDTAQSRSEGALHILEAGLRDGVLATGAENAQIILLALIDLIEKPQRETHRKRALKFVDPDSLVGKRLAADPIPDEFQSPITSRLKQWSASDKFRFPLLDFLKEVGNAEIAEEVEGFRARHAARMSNRMVKEKEDPFDGDILMTRLTWQRLQDERTRIGMELKTVLPGIIGRARELGDLKENAEYHAAKEKQANYAKRFEELEIVLNRVRHIEDLEREPGVAVPGTEINLEEVDQPGKTIRVWLLGEGDQQFGDSVVSYKAPVGEAILGSRTGEMVEVPHDNGSRSYRVLSVETRLPDSTTQQ